MLLHFCLLVLIQGLPVIPGGEGFGISTPGGSGRHLTPWNTSIFKVTTLNTTTGPGTLLSCINFALPRVCIFEVGGAFRFKSSVTIRNPYITIAGQTAPYPGVMLYGTSLSIRTHDVLISHLTVRTGDDPTITSHPERDSIGLYGQNLVLDHVSASYATDEVISSWYISPENEPRNLTLHYVFNTHSLHDSLHSKGPHGKASLIGPGTKYITIRNSLYAHHIDRNPVYGGGNSGFGDSLGGATYFELVNSVIYNYYACTYIAHNYITNNTDPQSGHIINNFYKRGPNSTKLPNIVVRIHDTVQSGSLFYIHNNFGGARVNYTVPDWNNVLVGGDGRDENTFKSTEPVFAPAVTTSWTPHEAYDNVLRNAGARPLQRDKEDALVAQNLREGTGNVINCVDNWPDVTDGRCDGIFNVGGYPEYKEVRRSLSVPGNPMKKEKNGYSRLENWLFGFSRDLEDFDCWGIHKDDKQACSGRRGKCVARNICECNPKFSFEDCSDFYIQDAGLVMIAVGISFAFLVPFICILGVIIVLSSLIKINKNNKQ